MFTQNIKKSQNNTYLQLTEKLFLENARRSLSITKKKSFIKTQILVSYSQQKISKKEYVNSYCTEERNDSDKKQIIKNVDANFEGTLLANYIIPNKILHLLRDI